MGFLLLPKIAERSGILGTEWLGYANCVSVFAPNGRHLVLHRLSGGFEPRRRFTLTGGEFFAEPQQGIALCGARETAASAAGTKRKGHLRFPFLFELLPFPCLIVRRRLPTCDRCEIGGRQRIFSIVSFATCSQFTNSVLLHMWLNQRRRDITVSRNTLACCNARHLRIKHSVQFIFAGAFRHNAQKNWAALSCRPLRGANLMCSSNLSVNCEYFTKDTQR